MPRLKTFHYRHQNKAGVTRVEKSVILVNVEGRFYCKPPEDFEQVLDLDKDGRYWEDSLEDLEAGLERTLRQLQEPDIEESQVLRFTIRTYVSFAVDDDGNIFPNASWPGAKWTGSKAYESEPAYRAPRDGYWIAVSAGAYHKKTIRFGDSTKYEYSRYYGDGNSHHNREHPAAILNQWPNAGPSDYDVKVREIPYSDAAAIFFNDLMTGIAKLARLIQENTFEEEHLLEAIHAKQLLLEKL